jgi:hypothetical protein
MGQQTAHDEGGGGQLFKPKFRVIGGAPNVAFGVVPLGRISCCVSGRARIRAVAIRTLTGADGDDLRRGFAVSRWELCA